MATPRNNANIRFCTVNLRVEDLIKEITDGNRKGRKDFLDPTFYRKIADHLKGAALDLKTHSEQANSFAGLIGTQTAVEPRNNYNNSKTYTIVPATVECVAINEGQVNIYKIAIQHTDKSVTELVFPTPILITLSKEVVQQSAFLPPTCEIISVDANAAIGSLEEFLSFKNDVNNLFKIIANDEVRNILLSDNITETDETLIAQLDSESKSEKYSNLLALYKKINSFPGTARINYSDFKNEVKDLLERIKANSQEKKFFHFLGAKSKVEVQVDALLTKHFGDGVDNSLTATSSNHRG